MPNMTYASVGRRLDAVQRRECQNLPESHPLIVMVDPRRKYIARRPRHQADGSAALGLEVERSAGSVPESLDAELLDLSRSGVRFRAAAPFSVGESVCVRLAHEASGLLLVRPATVQWIGGEREGNRSVGCHFDRPVEWETLGELFLNGILSTDRPLPKPEAPVPATGPDDSTCPNFNS